MTFPLLSSLEPASSTEGALTTWEVFSDRMMDISFYVGMIGILVILAYYVYKSKD